MKYFWLSCCSFVCFILISPRHVKKNHLRRSKRMPDSPRAHGHLMVIAMAWQLKPWLLRVCAYLFIQTMSNHETVVNSFNKDPLSLPSSAASPLMPHISSQRHFQRLWIRDNGRHPLSWGKIGSGACEKLLSVCNENELTSEEAHWFNMLWNVVFHDATL